ncbi:unnamed protein product, partial [Phaeothamnion confervicola]
GGSRESKTQEKAITAHHLFGPEPLFTIMKFIGSSGVVLVALLLEGCVGFLASNMWRKGDYSNLVTCSRHSYKPGIASTAPSSGLDEERSADPIARVEADIERVNDELDELREEQKIIKDVLFRGEGPYAGEESSFLTQQLVAVQGKDASLRREKEILLARMPPINE